MSITQTTQFGYDLQALLATFGESLTYRAKGGVDRTVTGIVSRRGQLEDFEDRLKAVKSRLITFLKDETNTTYGGVRTAKIGDVVVIDDADYAFTGTAIDENASGWTLEFRNAQTERMGGNTQR